MIHGHGGNIYQLAHHLGCHPDRIIDLSSNVNPIGPIPQLMDHLRKHLEVITALPQVDAENACTALAKSWNVDPAWMIAANGTTQFIYCLPPALGLKKVLICGPTYADYADGCRQWGLKPIQLTASPENDFRLAMDKLDKAASDADAVYLCNPNNPTGNMTSGRLLRDLAGNHNRTLFIIDQSYLPFVSGGKAESLSKCGLPNIIILHSLSKIFRIPGLRIGFLEAQPAIIEKISAFIQPWSVNSLAQKAIQWLADNPETVNDFISRSQDYCSRQRKEMIRQLATVEKLQVWQSRTSFLLARLPSGFTSDWLCRQLAEKRILIRNCSNFNGLDNSYFRLSLKTAGINKIVSRLIVSLLQNKPGNGV